ncbi:MAG TPA: cytochrome c oxidase subunit 3 [Saprospiraceae bacterium]|nr:cytochrome c oxidase subunit 3 [Saprospiraceae bacterium]
MKEQRMEKNGDSDSGEFNEYQSFAFHPYNVMMALLLFGITVLFLAFTAAFVYTRVQSNLPPIRVPGIFLFNTLVLLGSSTTMVWAKRSYQSDDTRNYQRALGTTILLSLLFMALQFWGWSQLFSQQIFIHSDNSAGYLYLISGLHFAHVIAGLPFLGIFLWTARKRMKEPVSVLVYFSDPEKRLKLRLLTIYWHFLDALWIYLVLFFFVNYLVR